MSIQNTSQDTKADQLKSSVKEDAEKIKSQAEREADTARHQAAGGISRSADVVRDTARSLERNRLGFASEYVDELASGIDSFSEALHERDLDNLAHTVRKFARRHPAAFAGGALLAGFAAARIARSSEGRSDQDYPEGFGQEDSDGRAETSSDDVSAARAGRNEIPPSIASSKSRTRNVVGAPSPTVVVPRSSNGPSGGVASETHSDEEKNK